MEIPWPTQEQYQPSGGDLLTLLHSYAHRTIRRLAAFAGIERDGLAEYLLPHHLAFVVYAASRGDFVLGGLQAVFETSLHRFLDDFVDGESRCALDPGCRSGGGACMACLHLGEPSCRWFNRFLDRSHLFGEHGFLARSATDRGRRRARRRGAPRCPRSVRNRTRPRRPPRGAARSSLRVSPACDPDLVDVLRIGSAATRDRIETACSLGAAWVMGRRSITA